MPDKEIMQSMQSLTAEGSKKVTFFFLKALFFLPNQHDRKVININDPPPVPLCSVTTLSIKHKI